jgi:hypothetical protein
MMGGLMAKEKEIEMERDEMCFWNYLITGKGLPSLFIKLNLDSPCHGSSAQNAQRRGGTTHKERRGKSRK